MCALELRACSPALTSRLDSDSPADRSRALKVASSAPALTACCEPDTQHTVRCWNDVQSWQEHKLSHTFPLSSLLPSCPSCQPHPALSTAGNRVKVPLSSCPASSLSSDNHWLRDTQPVQVSQAAPLGQRVRPLRAQAAGSGTMKLSLASSRCPAGVARSRYASALHMMAFVLRVGAGIGRLSRRSRLACTVVLTGHTGCAHSASIGHCRHGRHL